jgi:carbonic anhydrase/acetyltransferase-like protein (isoleucine patch superfamily)
MIRSFDGKTPRVAPSAFVSEFAYVVGDVEIGEDSSVWPGAVLRGDLAPIRIGKGTQIEDGCIVHTGIPMNIGDHVHCGHSVVIHCRRIGNNVLVGNNATLLDDAEIGDGCFIAAGALVQANAKIPDHSFVVGVPGKIKGEPPAKLMSGLDKGVNVYTQLARRYKEQGL